MPVVRRQLGEIADIYVGLPTKQSDIREAGRSGNVLTVRALTGVDIDRNELVNVNLGQRDASKYAAQAGDVLLSARSTSLRTAVVPEDLDGVIINATLIGVRCLPKLSPLLLVAFLNHPEGQASLETMAQTATAQMNITVAALRKIEVPVPPLEQQRRLADLLAAADEAYVTAIEAAESRRQLSQQVFIDFIQNKAQT